MKIVVYAPLFGMYGKSQSGLFPHPENGTLFSSLHEPVTGSTGCHSICQCWEGKDPDGRLAELFPRRIPRRTLLQHPHLPKQHTPQAKATSDESADDCYIDDPDQVHIYRKNPKWEALRLAELERQRHEEEELERWKEGKGEGRLQRIENKRNGKKAVRQKRKTNTK